ncbi:CPBP family intramembrane metalloprotease [Massilia sp. YIM B02763]|uniref:CPBP family intramembrane glutamic endopeptidase n=1 Tax=Massilia sp. YIM B02763 TaxID=3050130 RepID=UPI0025B6C4EF|nr:CPBP family intramembrane glutamic endopeptidase [Massilia sp. YIM B02763]MDN4055112.1 CPBP family intramembrane metalloprotease [Massilia sp. YIM B02763]
MSTPASTPPAAAGTHPQIRLGAQLLTCLGLCLVAAPIIMMQADPRAAIAGRMPLLWQVLVGQGLALVAAVASYLLYRLTAKSASTARTVESYSRLDLRGLNPLWISIAAAVGEEMLFRAALQPWLGVWIVSLLFLVTHIPVYRFRKLDGATLSQVAGIFGCSVLLGLVFDHVGLLAAVLVHLWIDVVGLVVVRGVIAARGK